MLLSNIEYVALRLVRRFLLKDAFLLRFGHWFPYYRVNHNQLDAARIAERYLALLRPLDYGWMTAGVGDRCRLD
jgi:hypothetical protein